LSGRNSTYRLVWISGTGSLLNALSRSRERNHDEKLFIKIPISYFSIHAVLNFCKSITKEDRKQERVRTIETVHMQQATSGVTLGHSTSLPGRTS
jgi:hypothetical protein